MTVHPSVPAGEGFERQFAEADPDLLGKSFVETLMSAEADGACGVE